MRKECVICRIRAHSNNSLSKYQRKTNLKLNTIKFMLPKEAQREEDFEAISY